MYRVSIIDAFCPRVYDDRSLYTEPMGGTESAVVLLAESLARYVQVEVIQHCRRHTHTSLQKVCYRGCTSWRKEAAKGDRDTVIIINSPKLTGLWRRQDKQCQILLWRHNFLGNRHTQLLPLLGKHRATMVCVSRYQQQDCLRVQRSGDSIAGIEVIPNAVQVFPNAYVPRDKDSLLFCSSPHKGLDEVVTRFREVRQLLPRLRLRICNPGYMNDAQLEEDGIKVLGALSRPELHAQMSASLCIFYPQSRFRETFGLVGAEANALGIPMLAPNDLGALPETLNGEGQLLESLSTPMLVEQLRHWRKHGTPPVAGQSRFDPDNVADNWLRLIQRYHTPDQDAVGTQFRDSSPTAAAADA